MEDRREGEKREEEKGEGKKGRVLGGIDATVRVRERDMSTAQSSVCHTPALCPND